MRRVWLHVAALSLSMSCTSMTRADEIGGRESERELEGDDADDVGDAFLFLPREGLRYFLLGSAIAARFAYDRQLLPGSGVGRHPRIFVFPTFFAETEQTLSVGARMVAEGGPFATSQTLGVGGARDLMAESKLQYAKDIGEIPLVFSAEGLAESKTELEYHGLGQNPEEDPRNQFVASPDFGVYEERRTRGILRVSVGALEWLRVDVSGSLMRRQIEDDEQDEDGQTLSAVFDGVRLWGPDTWLGYTEIATRVDTRPPSGPPLPGFTAEVYGGYGRTMRGLDAALARAGGRAAGFIPIYRDSNLLSPKLVLDTVAELDGRVPFTELARQPEYRGTDNRRDFVSLVASLDYIWGFSRHAAARLFVDAATVGPSLGELAIRSPRVAAGGGVDVFTRNTAIFRFWLSGSGDGFHVHVSVGTDDAYGDRQDRD